MRVPSANNLGVAQNLAAYKGNQRPPPTHAAWRLREILSPQGIRPGARERPNVTRDIAHAYPAANMSQALARSCRG